MNKNDLIRELEKISEVSHKVEHALMLEAEMNATKHMSEVVRPAPLVTALSTANMNMFDLIERIEVEGVTCD